LFAEAWIGYSLLRFLIAKRAVRCFKALSKTFEAKNYKSLFASRFWLRRTRWDQTNFPKCWKQAKKALAVSEQIQDSANEVRCLQAGTSMQLILGNYRESLAATFRALTHRQLTSPDTQVDLAVLSRDVT
jgi:hypothetical protein